VACPEKQLAALARTDKATVAELEADVASPYPGPMRAVLRALSLNE
jgi:hypothetical protein